MSRPVVVKVGGSLLGWPGLPDRLSEYLDARRRGGDRVILVVGGGPIADAIRDLDRIHALGESRSHALALRALDLTAHALAALVPGTRVTDELDALAAIPSTDPVPILAPRRFLDDDDRSPFPLPQAWTTTTDAIAARLAVRLGAIELALLKSAPLPFLTDRREAARLGLVDPQFPGAAEGLPIVSYKNLRDPSGETRTLAP